MADQALRLRQELDFLYQVALTVHSLELAELLQEIVEIASQITRADSCLIYLFDPDKQALVLRASKNPHPDLLRKISLKLGEGITGWVAQEQTPVVIASGARQDPRFKLFRSLPEDTFEAFLSVPIVNKQGVVGVINAQHKRRHVHADMEVNLLAAMGKLVGGAVENALLVEQTLELKEALELRKSIDKAKGILMHRKNISEAQAHQILQQQSMTSRKSLKDIAEAIILADAVDFSS